jgi:hypothetical protein
MKTTPQEDVSAIGTLIAKVAYLTDEGALEDYALAWSPDAELSAGADSQSGLLEIIAGAAKRREGGSIGPGSGLRHIVTPVSIQVDGDSAAAVTYVQVLAGTTTPTPALVYFSAYDDEFVRTPDGWRITRRSLRGLYIEPPEEQPTGAPK